MPCNKSAIAVAISVLFALMFWFAGRSLAWEYAPQVGIMFTWDISSKTTVVPDHVGLSVTAVAVSDYKSYTTVTNNNTTNNSSSSVTNTSNTTNTTKITNTTNSTRVTNTTNNTTNVTNDSSVHHNSTYWVTSGDNHHTNVNIHY